ncbi:DUF2490 domain-containing protein [Algoriphagus sp. NG3]|uniref:DUF2490 domain-containing protein n=1 Tax=Algoriphagus sp. NG3 TaxID=3097546 RepID=UPI002A839A33|nr:DUF2490 domain-containing protein [Algoriphagus sp. NG3]WPR77866.1 DUF2490 domain-containing protein [Algoriphagus sp. NG3]
MKEYLFLTLLFFYTVCASTDALAQNDSTELGPLQEVWPELNIYYHINDNFRLYGIISGTKMDESSYNEGAFSIFVDYFGLRAPISKLNFVGREERFRFRLRAGYLYSTTPPTEEDRIRSHTIRIQTANTFSISQKLRAYYKGKLDLGVSNNEFNARYVPRIILERDFRTEYLTFSAYAYAERFLDFQGRNLNRTRVALGANLKVSRTIDFETYYLHQFTNGINVPTVKAVGTRLKFYFSRKEKNNTNTKSFD